MERFTKRAKNAMMLAQEEAEHLRSQFVGTEHLLLGLHLVESGIASRVLIELGVREGRLRELINELAPLETRAADEPISLSPDTQRALEAGFKEAQRLGHHYIGTEHLLLGLANLADNHTVEIFKRLNIDTVEIHRQTERIIQRSPASVDELRLAADPLSSSTPSVLSEEAWFSLLGKLRFADIITSEFERSLQKKSPPDAASTIKSLFSILEMLNPWQSGSNKQLRISITDRTSGAVREQYQLPLGTGVKQLLNLLEAAASNTGRLSLKIDNDQTFIIFRIETDEDEDNP
jgi:hypothetical protein